MKTLKVWNGKGFGKYDQYFIYVAAYTKKQALELINKACFNRLDMVSYKYFTDYYANCWGNAMNGIIPTEPCLYVEKNHFKSDAFLEKIL